MEKSCGHLEAKPIQESPGHHSLSSRAILWGRTLPLGTILTTWEVMGSDGKWWEVLILSGWRVNTWNSEGSNWDNWGFPAISSFFKPHQKQGARQGLCLVLPGNAPTSQISALRAWVPDRRSGFEPVDHWVWWLLSQESNRDTGDISGNVILVWDKRVLVVC